VPVVADEFRTTDQNALLWRRYKEIADYINTHEWWIQDGEVLHVTPEHIHEVSKSILAKYLPRTCLLMVDESGVGLHYGEGTTTKLTRTDKGRKAFEEYYEQVAVLWLENYPNLILT